MSYRTIVIGDLQGMRKEADQLLTKLEVDATDWVIFAGDLVDRGPESGACVELAIEREAIQGRPAAILGNHEERHLRYWRKGEEAQIPTHRTTQSQLTAMHYRYMARLPLYIRLPEHNAAVVHAGCFPGRIIEQQDPYHLLHLQMINPEKGERTCWPSKVPAGEDGWKFWTHFWDGPERIIFGHSVVDKPLVTDKVCGIDGGACFGRQLHAVVLPGWEIVSIDCETDYGKGSRGRTGESVKTFLVHGDVSTYS